MWMFHSTIKILKNKQMKKYKVLIILLLTFFVINSCSQIAMMKKFNSGKPVYGQDISVVPFELD